MLLYIFLLNGYVFISYISFMLHSVCTKTQYMHALIYKSQQNSRDGHKITQYKFNSYKIYNYACEMSRYLARYLLNFSLICIFCNSYIATYYEAFDFHVNVLRIYAIFNVISNAIPQHSP